MKLLLHVCCAECLCGILDELQADKMEVVGFFYNPNIHPLLEFRRRLKAVKVFQQRCGIEIIYDEDYGLWKFLDEVYGKAGDRCERCYRLRLDRTAQKARESGIPSFSTTLLVSRHQKHDLIRKVGEEVAQERGVQFLYRDMRHLADRCATLAKKFGLYRQSYCGCIFSEYERYKDTTKHLWKGS